MTPSRLVALLAALLVAAPASAQEPIRFPRTPDVSPDGRLVAFSYLGDIWVVEAIGGIARPVTMHEAHDANPCFSPDGRLLAFSSNRHGSYDVFVVPVEGGKPRRLTFDSAQDMATGWTPDGKSVVFSSTRSTAYPPAAEAYTVPVDGGTERKLPLFEGKEAHFAPDGKAVAFTRGPGLWYRRGYRGSSNDDIWLASADGKTQERLTTFEGQDSYPMWAPDGKAMFYVSERFGPKGCANVVRQTMTPSGDALPKPVGEPTAVTKHADDTVRRCRLSGNGKWLVYECGADLWVAAADGSAPSRRLAIEVHADDKSNTERAVTFTRDATEFALSPDEKHAVLAVHGELFLVPVPDGGKATRLTDSPAYDHGASFAPDGKSVLFASDRGGVQDLYVLEADDPEATELTKAHKFKVRRLTDTPEEESSATFSPRGDRIAFVRTGQLWTMKPDGTGQTVLVKDKQVFDYDWSPDGKYVAFARMDGSFASELYVVPADGSAPPKNVTRYATYNGDVTWSQTNGRLAFVAQRQGSYAVHVLPLQKPGGGGLFGRDIDYDDIHLRAERPAALPADTAAISPDGSQVAFKSGTGGGDLWTVTADGRSLTRLTTGNQSPQTIRWSRKTTGLIYFLGGTGEIRTVRTGGGLPFSLSGSGSSSGPGEPGRVPFQAKMTVRRDEEFGEMFAQCWRKMSDFFYDPGHHGADWKAVREKYRPLVDHVAQREDLYALVSLMLGELNASHLGISGKLPTPDEETADLGLLFDPTFPGPGVKVAEVVKRGPADRRSLTIKAGDVIVAVDRVELSATTNLSRLLNNKAGESVRLDVTDGPGGRPTRRKVEVTAVNRSKASRLMYDRWVRTNADEVTRLSGGTLAYIHIPSMDTDGLETFVRALYSDAFDKDGVVVDVRYNGGGFTHDQVLAYLGGREHTRFRQRDGGEGLVLRSYDRKWTKPVTVLINNRSYSDAEIFPHAFRALGLGKVVGQATGGHVIGTTSTKLIDGSEFRVPRTGVWTAGGTNMEREGVSPDVAVDVAVGDWAKGVDTQVAKAVDVLSADVVAWKKARGTAVAAEPAPATKPPAPPPAPSPTGTAPGGKSTSVIPPAAE